LPAACDDDRWVPALREEIRLKAQPQCEQPVEWFDWPNLRRCRQLMRIIDHAADIERDRVERYEAAIGEAQMACSPVDGLNRPANVADTAGARQILDVDNIGLARERAR
jgi:hypothetical protein